jgi:hypothetical protein
MCIEIGYNLRYLNLDAFVDALDQISLGNGVRQLVDVESEPVLPSGLVQATIRARVGQAGFPVKVLEMYGENCAMSGPSIHAGLEAAHLVQYAEKGLHDFNAGLLLGQDLHALFDGKCCP